MASRTLLFFVVFFIFCVCRIEEWIKEGRDQSSLLQVPALRGRTVTKDGVLKPVASFGGRREPRGKGWLI
jgi:hypothetical protein